MRSQRAPLPRELAHYRADSLPASTHTHAHTYTTTTHGTAEAPRLSVCSTSGMVYESVVVVGHVVGSDHVVYYLLEVRSWDRPLEGYVVRRRYNDFKRLHQELSALMPTSTKPRSSSYSGGGGSSRGFGLPYSSLLLCTPLASSSGHDDGELHLVWSPKRLRTAMSIDDGDDSASTRKNTRSSSDDLESLDARTPSPQTRPSLPESWTLDPLLSPPPPATLTVEYDVPAAAAELGQTYYDSNLTLPLDRVKFTMADRAVLPDLPPAGVTALFATQHARIKHRVEQFNAILAAVMSDTSPAVATVLMNFIQEKPGGQVTSYTSLSEYAAIDMPWQVERYARRRAMSMGRRPPTLSRDVSSSSSVGSAAGRSSGTVTISPPKSAP